MTHQPHLIADEAQEYVVDQEEKAEYREQLRQKLQDPEFRQIEGFPIGDDEAILALSDPPYYTACPNPFLPDIIEKWQAERAALRAELGLPDDGSENGTYHREPFAADVSEGKSDPVYRAHSYHTKVPHKAVMRYILHYTNPGDIVFDGFCGTGMAGVASQLCGDRKAVESLGYRVDVDGVIWENEKPISRLGARKAVLNDLSPAATFITCNYNAPLEVAQFEQEAKRILREMEREHGWMYETWHPNCEHPQRVKAKINYTVWSDVFICPQCGGEIVFWNTAVDHSAGRVRKRFPCPSCSAEQTKTSLERAWETFYDGELDTTAHRAKQVPVLINYSLGTKTHKKATDADDLTVVQRIEGENIPCWIPSNPLPDGYNTRQPMESHGITHAHRFYFRRALFWLGGMFSRSGDDLRLKWSIFSMVNTISKLYRYVPKKPGYKGQGGGVLTGTLYVPALIRALSAPSSFRRSVSRITRAFRQLGQNKQGNIIITTGSATARLVKDMSLDYIFVDPPFGGNLMYSEINHLWEAWLQVLTDNETEAIVNSIQRKGLHEYQNLMELCFQRFYAALKSGRWMTVEFHNSQNRVWNAIQEAILRAGFVIADVRTLDKKQGTLKQITSTTAVKHDLIISAYKPRTAFERRFLEQAGSPEGAWAFVRQHLVQLPVVVEQDSALEVVAERQDYLLFDRMVAFHIQRGATVPLSAAEFYAGLRQRFVERDGMFFLPDQVPEYDRARLQAQEVAQLSLFVSDEKSSIQWLRQQLDPATGGHPQTYQQIQPQFLRQLHQARHEALPELSEILEQNFLQDKAGHWYVPDPNKASDLEKLRQRALLREFNQYVEGRGRLRQFRTDAVRAGFAHAWRERDYATIIKVAERLPERVLQEDPDLLMYYDNASLRT